MKLKTCFINNLESRLKNQRSNVYTNVYTVYNYIIMRKKYGKFIDSLYNFLIDLFVPNKEWLVRVNEIK